MLLSRLLQGRHEKYITISAEVVNIFLSRLRA